MSQIEVEYVSNNDKNDYCNKMSKDEFELFPAFLIRQLGIDKDFKGQGLSYYIILYCLGLGQLLNQKVGCIFLILRTTKKLAEKYYVPRYNFKMEQGRNKETVWVYRKLF